jgi:hypothetical protein
MIYFAIKTNIFKFSIKLLFLIYKSVNRFRLLFKRNNILLFEQFLGFIIIQYFMLVYCSVNYVNQFILFPITCRLTL